MFSTTPTPAATHYKHIVEHNHHLPIVYVNSHDATVACVAALEKEPAIAFDLEFDRDHFSYGFDLCLMQIASPTHVFLIDPMAGANVELLFPIMENEQIQKVVCSSGEDLRLMHSLECYLKNVVDTELYAKLLNYERPSLGAMLQELFGLVLDKKMQKINWTKRPLGEEQMAYAANDVRYLLPLKDELERQAIHEKLMPFVEEENALLSSVIYTNAPKENFLKKDDLKELSPYAQYVLNEMLKYRDSLAREVNKPGHHVISEQTIRSLVAGEINQLEWLDAKGVHHSLKTPGGRKLLYQQLTDVKAAAASMDLPRIREQPVFTAETKAAYEAERARVEHAREKVFKPIQQKIAEQFGEHTMRHILSGKMIDAIIQKQSRISDIKADYKKQLIYEKAKRLHIDLSEFE